MFRKFDEQVIALSDKADVFFRDRDQLREQIGVEEEAIRGRRAPYSGINILKAHDKANEHDAFVRAHYQEILDKSDKILGLEKAFGAETVLVLKDVLDESSSASKTIDTVIAFEEVVAELKDLKKVSKQALKKLDKAEDDVDDIMPMGPPAFMLMHMLDEDEAEESIDGLAERLAKLENKLRAVEQNSFRRDRLVPSGLVEPISFQAGVLADEVRKIKEEVSAMDTDDAEDGLPNIRPKVKSINKQIKEALSKFDAGLQKAEGSCKYAVIMAVDDVAAKGDLSSTCELRLKWIVEKLTEGNSITGRAHNKESTLTVSDHLYSNDFDAWTIAVGVGAAVGTIGIVGTIPYLLDQGHRHLHSLMPWNWGIWKSHSSSSVIVSSHDVNSVSGSSISTGSGSSSIDVTLGTTHVHEVTSSSGTHIDLQGVVDGEQVSYVNDTFANGSGSVTINGAAYSPHDPLALHCYQQASEILQQGQVTASEVTRQTSGLGTQIAQQVEESLRASGINTHVSGASMVPDLGAVGHMLSSHLPDLPFLHYHLPVSSVVLSSAVIVLGCVGNLRKIRQLGKEPVRQQEKKVWGPKLKL